MILYFHHGFESHSPIFVSIIIFAGFDLIVLRGNQNYFYASWDGTSNSVTVAAGSLGRVSLGIYSSGTNVYVLQILFLNPSSWLISSYSKASLSAGGLLGTGDTQLAGTTSDPLPFSSLVNGLVVCDTACQSTACSKYTLHE